VPNGMMYPLFVEPDEMPGVRSEPSGSGCEEPSSLGGKRRIPRVVIGPPKAWPRFEWRELWRYRDLWWMLSLRNIQVRYKQAVLGGLWALIQPLAAALVFTFVFQGMVGETHGVPYIVFVYSGMLAWLLFASSVGSAATNLVDNAPLITKVYFPRLLLPLSVIPFTLVDLIVGSVCLGVLMGWYGVQPGWQIVMLPLVIFWIVACSMGFAVFLAAVAVKYRDIRFVVPFLLQLWLFLSPVIYTVGNLPSWVRPLIPLNPMVGWIEAFRFCLVGTPCSPRNVLTSVVITVVAQGGALIYFRKAEQQFSDIV